MIESKNVFYVSNFNVIGGVETYIYELSRKYHDYDITIVPVSTFEEAVKYLENNVLKKSK